MATTLEVVNDCLASLGEAPLNTLAEPHEFKSTATRLLERTNRKIQSTGWWCNTEAITLKPSSMNYIQLPGDCLKWESGVRSSDTLVRSQAKPWLVQRGNRLYDTRNRTYGVDEEVTGELVRLVPFEELPIILNEYIAAATVVRFQSNIDADTQRRNELTQQYTLARIEARAEHIRQLKINFRNNNPRLAYIKSVTRGARRYIG
jgi:hypothetical protein